LIVATSGGRLPDQLFNKSEILQRLGDVAELLEVQGQPQATLIVVGGSFLVLQDIRATGTRDVDSIKRLTHAVVEAVKSVADQNDLKIDWLNDRAAQFTPVGFDESECEVLFDHPALLVLGPAAECVFLMKLHAHRVQDYEDMIGLWPRCNFGSSEEVVEQYEAAYPHEEKDPYFADYVTEIASASWRRQPDAD
jgi:hypothetical protein